MIVLPRWSSVCFFLIVGFIASSFWQRTIGDEDVGLAGRLVYGDLFLALSLVAAVFSNVVIRARLLIFALALLLVALSAGALFSDFPLRVMAEVAVHGFLFAGFAVMVAVLNTERRIRVAIVAFLVAGAVASIVGAIDSVLFSQGRATILEAPGGYTALGAATFRNYGQSGNYASHVALLAAAVLFSKYGAGSRLFTCGTWVALILSLVLLAISSKVASIAGLLCGIFAMAATQLFLWRDGRPLKILIFTGLGFLAIVFTLVWFGGDDLSQRLTGRALSRIASESGGGGFAASNWAAAFRAFGDDPVFGTGIGAFAGVYHDYAVHSTFLKLLAEGGAASFLAFLFAVALVFVLLPKSSAGGKDSGGRLCALLGWGLVGLTISWLYTYGLRKREFWILLAIFVSLRTVLESKRRASLSMCRQ